MSQNGQTHFKNLAAFAVSQSSGKWFYINENIYIFDEQSSKILLLIIYAQNSSGRQIVSFVFWNLKLLDMTTILKRVLKVYLKVRKN